MFKRNKTGGRGIFLNYFAYNEDCPNMQFLNVNLEIFQMLPPVSKDYVIVKMCNYKDIILLFKVTQENQPTCISLIVVVWLPQLSFTQAVCDCQLPVTTKAD